MQKEDMLVDINQEQALSMLPPATGSSKINVGTEERIVSAVAGAAAAIYGLKNINSIGGITMAIAGGLLLSRGISGYCMVNNAIGRNSVDKKSGAMEANQSMVINRPRAEVYAFWRRLENLPTFMKHLEQVTAHDHVRSTWVAKVPGGLGTVTWEALIEEDKPGELLSWSSLPGSTIDNAGEVRFEDAAEGTRIHVKMDYRLPAGDVGSLAGQLFNPAVEKMMKSDIERFKSIMETSDAMGNVANTSDFSADELEESSSSDFSVTHTADEHRMGEPNVSAKRGGTKKKPGTKRK